MNRNQIYLKKLYNYWAVSEVRKQLFFLLDQIKYTVSRDNNSVAYEKEW